jgi:hypothetical protein
MSQIGVTALLALSALALLTSTAFAQAPALFPPVPDRSGPGVNDDDLPLCQAAGGGSRMRENCDIAEPKTERTEQELKISIELPAVRSGQCGATTTTEYYQVNTIARVNSKLQIVDCTVASGTFTVALRVRDENGEEKPLEFSETWQRSDDQDVTFAADYPIGENVELRSVRVRGLRCTCADPPSEVAAQ